MAYHYATDRLLAEAVLRQLCVGARVDGIRFGPVPQLLLTDPPSGKPTIRGQIYLNLGTSWRIFPSRPASLPRGETEMPELEESEALRQLCDLREAVIATVELGADAPDLSVSFEDGRLFYLNGRHEHYETWQFGVAFSPDLGTLVVACPGNEIAVWALPEAGSRRGAV